MEESATHNDLCVNPHLFLITLVFSLSHKHSIEKGILGRPSFISLGYFFTVIDVSEFMAPKTPKLPDFLLVNINNGTVIAVEVKGGPYPPLESLNDKQKKEIITRINEKFSGESIEVLEQIVYNFYEHLRGKPLLFEKVIFTYDTYEDSFYQLINDYLDNPSEFILWITPKESGLSSSKIESKSGIIYSIKKSKKLNSKHNDEKLDEFLTRGLFVDEQDIICRPLLEKDINKGIIYYEITNELIRRSFEFYNQDRSFNLFVLVNEIKKSYPTPVSGDVILEVIKDFANIFPHLASVNLKKNLFIFKKKPPTKQDLDIIQKFKTLGNAELEEFIKKLKAEREAERKEKQK